MKPPCRYCADRKEGCHAVCGKYKKYEGYKVEKYKNSRVKRLGSPYISSAEYKRRAIGIEKDSRGRRNV